MDDPLKSEVSGACCQLPSQTLTPPVIHVINITREGASLPLSNSQRTTTWGLVAKQRSRVRSLWLQWLWPLSFGRKSCRNSDSDVLLCSLYAPSRGVGGQYAALMIMARIMGKRNKCMCKVMNEVLRCVDFWVRKCVKSAAFFVPPEDLLPYMPFAFSPTFHHGKNLWHKCHSNMKHISKRKEIEKFHFAVLGHHISFVQCKFVI